MKVYISTDIEGCTGVGSFSQCGRPAPDYYDYRFARRMMTHDVNAAIRGARAAGATRVVVKDAHATCRNLLIDQLEPGTELISGFTMGGDGMMQGVDGGFDAALLVGYHSMGGVRNGMMDHALIGGLHFLLVNGTPAGEILVSAAIAGAYGVPLVAVTSDEVGCGEAIAAVPGVRTFATKEGYGHVMGRMLSPEVTNTGIYRTVQQGIANPSAPVVFEGDVTFRMAFRTVEEADLAALAADVARLDGYTLELTRATFLEAHAAAQVVFSLSMQGRRSVD